MSERRFTKDFFIAALIRGLKTAAQVMLSMITVGRAITSFDWVQILSITATAFVYSLLTSIVFGIPEGEYQGKLHMEDYNNDGNPVPVINLEIPSEAIADRNNINIKVEKEM